MKAKLAITLGVFIGLGTAAAWADDTPWTHEGKPWTRSEILAIADQKAQQLGYDVERMSVSFDYHNSKWAYSNRMSPGRVTLPNPAGPIFGDDNNSSTPKIQPTTIVVPIEPAQDEKLIGRDLFAIYYAPLQAQNGGDLWVLFDRHTGKIITTIGGK